MIFEHVIDSRSSSMKTFNKFKTQNKLQEDQYE